MLKSIFRRRKRNVKSKRQLTDVAHSLNDDSKLNNLQNNTHSHPKAKKEVTFSDVTYICTITGQKSCVKLSEYEVNQLSDMEAPRRAQDLEDLLEQDISTYYCKPCNKSLYIQNAKEHVLEHIVEAQTESDSLETSGDKFFTVAELTRNLERLASAQYSSALDSESLHQYTGSCRSPVDLVTHDCNTSNALFYSEIEYNSELEGECSKKYSTKGQMKLCKIDAMRKQTICNHKSESFIHECENCISYTLHDKPTECDICNKSFNTQDQLNEHIAIHFIIEDSDDCTEGNPAHVDSSIQSISITHDASSVKDSNLIDGGLSQKFPSSRQSDESVNIGNKNEHLMTFEIGKNVWYNSGKYSENVDLHQKSESLKRHQPISKNEFSKKALLDKLVTEKHLRGICRAQVTRNVEKSKSKYGFKESKYVVSILSESESGKYQMKDVRIIEIWYYSCKLCSADFITLDKLKQHIERHIIS